MTSKPLEKFLETMVSQSKIVGPRSGGFKIANDCKGELLSFRSYDPGLLLEKDVLGLGPRNGSLDIHQDVCLIPKRDTKYLTFKDKYYLLFKSNYALRQFLLEEVNKESGVVMSNSGVRLNIVAENQKTSFLRYYFKFYSTLMQYQNEDQATIQKPSTNDIITLHNRDIRPILESSLLLWRYQNSVKEKTERLPSKNAINKTFWYYNIKKYTQLFENVNDGITLHLITFYEKFDRDKFQLNLHGTIYQNERLLIESL